MQPLHLTRDELVKNIDDAYAFAYNPVPKILSHCTHLFLLINPPIYIGNETRPVIA